MTDFITRVEQDAAAALAEVKSGLTFLETEGQAVLAWVEKEVPGASGAIALFMQEAETATADLARVAANGMSKEVSALVDELGTTLLNFISATHLNDTAKTGLKSIDVSAVALVKTVGQNAIASALAKVLGSLATAAIAAA